MAIAIALGCAAVALETASELSSRSTIFHRRMEVLRGRILELRTEAADAGRYLAAVRAEHAAHANVNRVLSAADVVVLRLKPGTGSNARGMAAISRQAGSAILEISGLPPAGHTYLMWWQLAKGSSSKAAELRPDADGVLSVAVQMPPKGASITGAIVTLEEGNTADRPNGKVILKGEILMP